MSTRIIHVSLLSAQMFVSHTNFHGGKHLKTFCNMQITSMIAT